MNRFKEKLIRQFCLKTWRIWESLGFHIIPNHFYWPIADTRKLQTLDFERAFPMNGVTMDLNKMKELIGILGSYRREYESIHTDCGYASNGDGAILYGMIRKLKPKKVIEVGSGYSTVIIDHALRRNIAENNDKGEIISIEPYPKPVLRDLEKTSDNVCVIENGVEHVDTTLFKSLGAGDVLFIDSSHVVDIGNDVHYLYLHILPTLPVGVVVHIHDIRYPYEYPREWVIGARKYWSEQYLLHMFLAFNDSFEVILASNYCYRNFPSDMSRSLVGLACSGGGWPGSFWIRRHK